MQIGLEHLRENPNLAEGWGRCGLLCNQASLARDFAPAWTICREILRDRLVCLFGPQHGLEATVQDNMIETAHGHHAPSGLPVYSLYATQREPTAEMVAGIDTIVIDLQTVGTRVYTFKYTIAGILRAAARFHKRVVVLDRPNPLGGATLEGRVLSPEVRSFVGEFPLPMRHGLTAGEASLFFNSEIGAELEVVPLQGWQPQLSWQENDAQRAWVLTSPNMPTLETVQVFSGTVIFEGTNVSEGRGTCLPFQLLGASWVADATKLVARIKDLYPRMEGIHLRPTQFIPTNQKEAGKTCNGFQIHLTDIHKARVYRLALAALRAFIEFGGDNFCWKTPPYEYEYEKPPIDLIIGAKDCITKFTAANFTLEDEFWHEGIDEYWQTVKTHLLYERTSIL